jgi:hypothetical protein
MFISGPLLGAGQQDQLPGISQLHVRAMVRKMCGGAQGNLVRCSDGGRYILKTYPSPQGPNALANDALGSCLLRGLGLSTPKAGSAILSEAVIRRFPSLAIETPQGLLLPRGGFHFASQFFGSPEWETLEWLMDPNAHRIANRGEFLGMLVFDIWASHRDRRQCIYRVDPETSVKHAFFIDNGHLFGGPDWSMLDAGRQHSIFQDAFPPQSATDAQLWAWVSHFQTKLPKLLTESIKKVPALWYQGDIRLLEARLLARLQDLPNLVERELAVKGTPITRFESTFHVKNLRVCSNRALCN